MAWRGNYCAHFQQLCRSMGRFLNTVFNRGFMLNSDPLKKLDDHYTVVLLQAGRAIGYGRSQQILGELWDKELAADYGIENPARGRMGVTIDDALPPVPKAANKRRQQGQNGSYCVVPAYTRAEMEAYAHQAIAKALAKQAAA